VCDLIFREASRNIDNTPKTSAKLPPFREKFRTHLDAGTKPFQSDELPRPPWTVTTLIDAMKPRLGVTVPSPVAVRKWFRDDVVPRQLYIDAILDAFFGEDPHLARDRTKFLGLWEAARAETQRGRAEDDDDATGAIVILTDDWIIATPKHQDKNLAALWVHPPEPSNDPNTFLLQVSLSHGLRRLEIDIGDDEFVPVTLGLQRTQIEASYVGCMPDSRLSDHDHLLIAGDNYDVVGPRGSKQLLDGISLEKATLATMTYLRRDAVGVDLQLLSLRGDLVVLDVGGEQVVSENRRKALKLLFEDKAAERTAKGYLIWSSASLKRRGNDDNVG